jgi:hypothetical protein
MYQSCRNGINIQNMSVFINDRISCSSEVQKWYFISEILTKNNDANIQKLCKVREGHGRL